MTSTLESIDSDLFDVLTRDAIDNRSGLALPSLDDGPRAVLEHLADVRTKLDAVDELLNCAVRYRSQVRLSYKLKKSELDDQWNSHVTQLGQRSRSSDWGAPAPRERYAEADVATLDTRIEVRRLESLLDLSNDAVDVISRVHRGLNDKRSDLHLILRAMSVESSLER